MKRGVMMQIINEVICKTSKKIDSIKKTQKKLFNISHITNEFGEQITRIDGDIDPQIPIKNGDRFLFISYEQTKYTHGLHKYPAKFFPELPRFLIQRYAKEGDIIVDPFMGSATTNVEAMLLGYNSYGIDIDPFAKFLSKVKTTPLAIYELKIATQLLIEKIKEYKPHKAIDFIPDFPYKEKWFEDFILDELAFIKKTILSNFQNDLKDFFLITFSSIIRNVSNADDNCTRTVVRKKLNKKIYPSMALTKFVENLLLNEYRMEEFCKRVAPHTQTTIISKDARTIHLPSNSVDLALTSPPYVNAVDYPRTHQLEIYWLGFAKESLLDLKKEQIGTETVYKKEYEELHSIGIKIADTTIAKIYNKDKRRAYIAYKFLMDMEKNLQEIYRILQPGGRYIVAIGNNKIRDEIFESWKYLIEIAQRVGFRIELYFGSEIIKHFIKVKREERINTDWIIVLRKPDA